MRDVEIRGEMIRLGQFLKFSGLADSGSEARDMLLDKQVTVNGEPEARRGRQLHRDDVVEARGQAVRVA